MEFLQSRERIYEVARDSVDRRGGEKRMPIQFSLSLSLSARRVLLFVAPFLRLFLPLFVPEADCESVCEYSLSCQPVIRVNAVTRFIRPCSSSLGFGDWNGNFDRGCSFSTTVARESWSPARKFSFIPEWRREVRRPPAADYYSLRDFRFSFRRLACSFSRRWFSFLSSFFFFFRSPPRNAQDFVWESCSTDGMRTKDE